MIDSLRVTEVRETPCDWHGKNLEEACRFPLKLSKSNRNVFLFFFTRMCWSISLYSPSLCSSPNHYVGRGTTVQWAAPCVVTETGRNKLERVKKGCQKFVKTWKNTGELWPREENREERAMKDWTWTREDWRGMYGLATQSRAAKKYDIYKFWWKM